ncbi:amidohydrolase family protein [Bariatricus massiliensis]|uniref:Amidohydrolase family protein n=1 Tax=Bariatricus massiliensis TaxID=1745713 RepID=A0ABS8DDR3_9FIRM|nr:amidohydrolase family protein [Bariatricus massiliensis]MCB7302664.1 amidohydrolase family protein [Bariatricus massiliensis]MCB7373880.1 amidohydrolase family protein [Bariatricus massiliensis]MCB7386550.1 amidohydrolase family protein [Bariatricus massiliensis]MCB7410712.1 amidohydrolase family protein [Bariatricus massiliensis]MCQ5253450.1 amidohydrolase family protein [Bariatricus massiliensis]
MNRYVIKNCKLIPELTEGTGLSEADVLIEEDRIADIAEVGTVFEDISETIDVGHATLMPGLIDAHVHLRWLEESSWVTDVRPSWRSFDEYHYARFMLENGYTTVRDCGDDKCLASEAVRDAEKAGYIEGPRVICAGPTLLPANLNTFPCRQFHHVIAGRDNVRALVRDNICYGADFIKLYGSGSLMTEGNDPNIKIIEEDEIDEVVKIATSRGTYCAIHAHGSEAIDAAVRNGVRTIEHASFITEETLQRLEGRTDMGIVPTVGILHNLTKHGKGSYVDNEDRRVKTIRQVYECIGNAYHNHNVLIGWGTDIALDSYEENPYIEIQTRKNELGFSNIDILKQMTINSAKLLCLDNEIGTVKIGKCADFVVIDGNPAEDIAAMYKKPVHVIRKGRVIY